VVRLRAELTFGATAASGAAGWTEVRNLAPVYYAIYDSNAESSAAIRALVYAEKRSQRGRLCSAVSRPRRGTQLLDQALRFVAAEASPSRAQDLPTGSLEDLGQHCRMK
jgi:hypothetical protein